MRVSLSKSHRSFSVAPDQPVLEAALGAGLNLPHSCKGGNCGSCRARLLEGEIEYPHGRPLGLSDSEVAEGLILLCQARAKSDLSLETFEPVAAGQAGIKRLPCRIERIERFAHDVLGVFLRLPAAEHFEFFAGQYLDVMLPQGRRRSFSIASPPHDARVLELHVRRVPGGELTERLFNEAVRGTLLSIQGPLGHFYYREAAPTAAPGGPSALAAPGGPAAHAAPLLLVGGGTGLAPLKSILRHVIEGGSRRPLTLYWGVRSERDLYAHEELCELARGTPSFSYVPVLSEPSENWAGRRGWVHEAVIEDGLDLARYDVYSAGPPAMIEAVRRDLPARGAAPARLYFDSFDYAPDARLRQRSIASTKS